MTDDAGISARRLDTVKAAMEAAVFVRLETLRPNADRHFLIFGIAFAYAVFANIDLAVFDIAVKSIDGRVA